MREFLDNPDPGKRDRLIEVLFNSPEYVDYWTFRLADLFRVAMRSTGTLKDTRMYWEWIRDAVARNRPYDQIARERIGAQGYDGPSRHYYHLGGELPTPANMMAEQLRVFLGRRLDCAQCHNHPYERWSQDQFWGLAAFFGRVSRIGQIGMEMIIIDDPAGHGQFGQGEQVIHPRTRRLVEPRFLDGRPLPEEQRTDLRMKLAQWVTAHPYFAEAAVNRLWSTFFGRGLVDPVDDFRLTHPPSHPGLLRALARDFREQGHDLKRLMRQIVRSRTYQLSGRTNRSNGKDRTNYSRALPRPLDAEVVLDAISQFTGISEDLLHWDPGREPPGTRAINVVWPDVVPSHFLELHGRPDRQMIPERTGGSQPGPGAPPPGGRDLYPQAVGGGRAAGPVAAGAGLRRPSHRRALPGGAVALPGAPGNTGPAEGPGGSPLQAGSPGGPGLGHDCHAGVRLQPLTRVFISGADQ